MKAKFLAAFGTTDLDIRDDSPGAFGTMAWALGMTDRIARDGKSGGSGPRAAAFADPVDEMPVK